MATVQVRVADPGQSEEVEILSLRVAVGQQVAAGEIVAEVATDKVNVDVESPVSGRVSAVCVEVGSFVAPDAALIEVDVA